MFIKTADADLFVTSFGSGGHPLVTHGGWVGSGELWSLALEDLSRVRRCISFDHRGTGATVSRAPAITFDLLVQDLLHVIDALGVDRCVLAAESAGAMVALATALQRPERFDGLVLVAPRFQGARTPGAERLLQGCRTDFEATMDAFVDACVPEEDCAAERAWGRKIVKRSTAREAIELMECLEQVDLEPRLPGLRLPVLVVHGTRDAIVPMANAERLAALLPRSRLMKIDAGHVPMVTRPREISRAIQSFMADLPGPLAPSRGSA